VRKLILDLDSLRVETFDTSPGARGHRGTVKGYATDWNCPTHDVPTLQHSCIIATCGYSCDTCGYSCDGGCTTGGTEPGTVYDPSCGGTCNGGVTCYESVCIPL
jgi:hypothetical protein